MGVNASTASDLIELTAENSINEESHNNGGIEVGKKFNINFGGLKLSDSKKRLRPPTFGSTMQYNNQDPNSRIDQNQNHEVGNNNYNEEMEII